eukprot:1291654-Pyramimonas_sp.AAC.1
MVGYMYARADQAMLCKLCSAIHVLQSMSCNMCGGARAVQSRWSAIRCGASGVVQPNVVQ